MGMIAGNKSDDNSDKKEIGETVLGLGMPAIAKTALSAFNELFGSMLAKGSPKTDWIIHNTDTPLATKESRQNIQDVHWRCVQDPISSSRRPTHSNCWRENTSSRMELFYHWTPKMLIWTPPRNRLCPKFPILRCPQLLSLQDSLVCWNSRRSSRHWHGFRAQDIRAEMKLWRRSVPTRRHADAVRGRTPSVSGVQDPIVGPSYLRFGTD